MRILNVAEKPSMARQIASLLAGDDLDSFNGKNKYCRNYVFPYNFHGQASTMVVTSVLGHLKELDFPPEYGDWQTVPVHELFQAPVVSVIPQPMLDVAENLRAEARRANILIIWTDCDREGEYIGSEIVQLCTSSNLRLNVYRARYSVLSTTELHRVMRSLGRLDERQVAAAALRGELDLRSGAAFTRLQTLQLRRGQAELRDRVISYGSCQFPTLGFIVEQYLRLIEFCEEPFWYIQLETRDEHGVMTRFSWQRKRLYDHLVALILYERCRERPKARITSIESKPTTKWRPLPLRTVELQKFGSRYLKISSDRVMDIAEKLYNQGYISYPRTETDMFEPDFDLKTLLGYQKDNPKWGSYANHLLNEGGFRPPRKGKNNDKAHPPIHPTRAGIDLVGAEAKVYEFIAKRFLACCSDDARGLETIVMARIGDESFRARGVMVTALNYLEIYTYENWNDQRIGQFTPHQEINPHSLELLEGLTTPPKLLSESELIGTMDKNGIGTDATIHEHIKKILERQYVIKNGEGRFHPTNLGLALVKGYDCVGLEESLTKPRLRATMEQRLKDICEGAMTKADVADMMISQFRQALDQVNQRLNVLLEQVELCARNGSLFSPAPLPPQRNTNAPPPRQVPTTRSRPNNEDYSTSGNEDDMDDGGGLVLNEIGSRQKLMKLPKKRKVTDKGFGKDFKTAEMKLLPRTRMEQDSNCNCGRPAQKRVTRKAGINCGRAFWSCSECNYFAWADEGNRKTATAKNQDINCNCGQAVVERTVAKEGPNQGRKFAACPDQVCNFFQWLDAQSNLAISSTDFSSNLKCSNLTSNKFGHEQKCKCGLEAARLVTANGSNAGRAFFKCTKIVKRCDYFEWEDGVEKQSYINNGTKALSISCFKCGENGHFAKSCPNGENNENDSEYKQPLQRGGRGRRGSGGGRKRIGTMNNRKRKYSKSIDVDEEEE